MDTLDIENKNRSLSPPKTKKGMNESLSNVGLSKYKTLRIDEAPDALEEEDDVIMGKKATFKMP